MSGHHIRGAMRAARTLAALAAVSVPALFCQDRAFAERIYKGPAVGLGHGTAQAWVAASENGEPQALGVSISESALAKIEHAPRAALTLPLPMEATGTGFDHVFLNWNPHGHPPGETYRVPHFDVHFYLISPAVRETISPEDPEFMAKAERAPDARFVPVDHIPPPEPEPVPGMGVHWVDATTPELNGEPFTHTLLYGAWDGQFIFIEPMVTKAVLDERQTVVAPVKQPAEVAARGWYPTRYRIEFDPSKAEHRIVLEGLVPRD